MHISRTIGVVLVIAALAGSALPAAAQDGDLALEGTRWTLVSYADDAGPSDVPLGIDANLLLEDGTASGSSGCNSFSGNYELDGDFIAFDEAFTTTLRACLGDADAVERAFYAALPDVEEWFISGSTLDLLDDDAETLLTFDTSSPGDLTSAAISRLIARIDALEARVERTEERIDDFSIGRLRERIRDLEADNETLKSQVASLRSAASTPIPGGGNGSDFDRAEVVLLEGIPTRFHARCSPLRSGLPDGAAAAVSCRPNTNRVAAMAYYLMEGEWAVRLYNEKMDAAGVPRYGDILPPEVQLCDEGVPSSIAAGGGYIGMEGCYRADGRANLRVVEQLTDCQQLEIGPTQLMRPVMYLALTGPNSDISALHTWANRNPSTNLSRLIIPLGDSGEPPSPDCFTS